jgi:hypothetical protein
MRGGSPRAPIYSGARDKERSRRIELGSIGWWQVAKCAQSLASAAGAAKVTDSTRKSSSCVGGNPTRIDAVLSANFSRSNPSLSWKRVDSRNRSHHAENREIRRTHLQRIYTAAAHDLLA